MFKRDIERTPKQKAERAQMNILARLAGCGFLVYFVVKLLKTPPEESPGQVATIIISAVLIILGAVVIGFTVFDFITGLRTGRYKAATYEEVDIADYLENSDGDLNDMQQDAKTTDIDDDSDIEDSSDDESDDDGIKHDVSE